MKKYISKILFLFIFFSYILIPIKSQAADSWYIIAQQPINETHYKGNNITLRIYDDRSGDYGVGIGAGQMWVHSPTPKATYLYFPIIEGAKYRVKFVGRYGNQSSNQTYINDEIYSYREYMDESSDPGNKIIGTLYVESTIPLNTPPTIPNLITVPSSVKSGQNLNITWGASTDTDGDAISYRLERSINGASYSQIYNGTSRSHIDNIGKGWNTITYRVYAYDGKGASGYRISNTVTVINNEEPNITIDQPISNKRIGNQDNIYINGSIKDADVGDILKVKYNLANINNREVTLTQPKSIVSNGQNQSFQGFINLNGLSTGKSILELYAEDNKGGISNKVIVPINIFNSLESILKGLKSYTYKSGQPQIMVINTNTNITQSIENDKLIEQIKQELNTKNVRLFFMGNDGDTEYYIKTKLLK